MKRLLLFLLLAASCTAAAQKRPTTDGLSALQDSIWQWAADNKAARSGRKRHLRIGGQRTGRCHRRTHDPSRHGDESPLPPLRARQPPDPAPRVRPRHDTLSARTRRGCSAGWAHDGCRIRILSRRHRTYPAHDPPQRRFDGIFRERLHRLPLPARTVGNAAVVNAWNSLLVGIGPNNPSRTEVPHPAPAAEYTYGFTARLAPRVYPARYARYRICKQVYKTCPYRPYLLTAEFTVTPFVPFTRFAEPAEGQDIQF